MVGRGATGFYIAFFLPTAESIFGKTEVVGGLADSEPLFGFMHVWVNICIDGVKCQGTGD